MAPSSRIPRTASASAPVTADENDFPPTSSTTTSKLRSRSRIPSAAPLLQLPPPPSTRLSPLDIALHAPTSDPAYQMGQETAEEVRDGQGRAAKASTTRSAPAPVSKLPRTRAASAQASLAPPAPRPRGSSRSPSAQNHLEPIPAGPSHAPHVLAARRRSSVSPLPPSTSTSARIKPDPSPQPPSLPSSSSLSNALPKPSKAKTRRQLRPRPSETLPTPLALNPSDSEADDPLLLLGPEETRGKGEGKTRRVSLRVLRRGTPAPREEMRASRSRETAAVEVEEAEEQAMEVEQLLLPELGEQEQEQEDVEYGGGYEDHGDFFDNDLPPRFPSVEGEGEEEEALAEEEEEGDEADYGQTESYMALAEPDSGSDGEVETQTEAEEDETMVEEQKPAKELPEAPLPALPSPVAVDAEGDEDDLEPDFDLAETTVCFALPPSSPARPLPSTVPSRPSPVASSSTSAALRHSVNIDVDASASRGRSSYPPLSPDLSGEHDEVVAVRLDSSPVRAGDRELPDEEVEEEEEEEEAIEEQNEEAESVEVKEAMGEEQEGSPVPKEEDLEEQQPQVQQQQHLAPPPTPSFSSTARRTLSPAVLSPFFRHTSSAAQPPSRSTPHHDPCRVLTFASPRLPSERYPSLSLPHAPSPAPVPSPAPSTSQHPHPTPQPAQSHWTRGPAFFRSSSFSPPPGANQPRSATLFTRRPGKETVVEEERAEKSREYHRFADLTVSSPGTAGGVSMGGSEHGRNIREMREEVRRVSEELKGEEYGYQEAEEEEVQEQEEEQAEEEEEEQQAPPTPAKDVGGSLSPSLSPARSVTGEEERAEGEEDEKMVSPVAPRHSSFHSDSASPTSRRSHRSPSPSRSPGGENLVMSSPSHSVSSPRHQHRTSLSPSPSLNKSLPITPSVLGADEADLDARMGSPSPAKRADSVVAREGGSVRRSARRVLAASSGGGGGAEGLVEMGARKLQGLLFGPNESRRREETVEVEGEAAVEIVEEREQQRQEEVDDEDEPFPQLHLDASANADAGPSSSDHHLPLNDSSSSFSTSAYLSRSQSTLSASTSSRRKSTSHRRSRPRPSHPSLPVIEISSTDARAAARAAAILKCYHSYVAEGVEAVDPSTGEKSVAHEEGQEEDEEEEEELRTLLLDAEEELRQGVPRRRSESIAADDEGGSFVLPPPPSSSRRPQQSTLTTGSTSAKLLHPQPQPSATTSSRSRTRTCISSAHKKSGSTSSLSTLSPTSWSSSHWRALESVLVSLGRRARRSDSASLSVSSVGTALTGLESATGEEVEAEEVVREFLGRIGVAEEREKGLEGEWSWDTLIVRVNALKARRAKDYQKKRDSSVSSSSFSTSTRASAYPQRALAPVEEQAEEAGAASEDDEEQRTRSASPPVKVEEQSQYASSSSSSDDEESRDVEDDTFFNPGARSSKDRRRDPRRSSVQPVYRPTGLVNPALRHLYDDTPPEKPRVPLQDFRRASEGPAEEEGQEGEEDEASNASRERETTTPEQDNDQLLQPPTSAQRLFSYLGSFVRRSPAPEPESSPSSMRVASAHSSASSSPEPSLSPSVEMSQICLPSASSPILTPRSTATTSKPFPPLPQTDKSKRLPHPGDRKILPLPPSHFPSASSRPVASTSRQTLDDNDSSSSSFELSTPRLASLSNINPRRRRSSGEGGRVSSIIAALEEAESSREEEEARIVALLQSGGAKRRAVAGDLRGGSAKGKGKERAVERNQEQEGEAEGEAEEWRAFVEVEVERNIVHAGTRALDRRPSGETRASLRR